MSANHLATLRYLTSQNSALQSPQPTELENSNRIEAEILALFQSLREVIRIQLGTHTRQALANLEIPGIVTKASTVAAFYENNHADGSPEAIVCFTKPDENRARFIAVDNLNDQAHIKNSGISLEDGVVVLRNFKIQLQHPGSVLLRFEEAHEDDDIGLATTLHATHKKSD